MGLELLDQRRSGVLLHLTSLPGAFGHGDLGPAAHRFAAFLAAAGQSWWQMLPIVPWGRGNSPYDTVSSFAGGARLISLERLAEEGLLEPAELRAPRSLGRVQAQYEVAACYREARLRRAFDRFQRRGRSRRDLERYQEKHRSWLADYTLFCALKSAHPGSDWTQWDRPLKNRHPAVLARARRELAEQLRFHAFAQYQFDRQWRALRSTCHRLGIALLGDLPMFVAHDSADVWSNQDLFCLDRRGRCSAVVGTPPDAFSRTGQLWGNPPYRWQHLEQTDFAWWIARLRRTLQRFDTVRLDHFIGLHRYWRISALARTARLGRFVLVPGERLLAATRAALGGLPLVAEDLGLVTPQVHALRDRFELPGMRVLQFAFDEEERSRRYLPHRYPARAVAYTGTHDNDTLVGWYRSLQRGADAAERRKHARSLAKLRRYSGSDGRQIHWDLIRLVLMSRANTTIFPLQDLLGLGSRARMNIPGTATGNWRWRVLAEQLDPALADRMAQLCTDYERVGGFPQRRSARTHN